MSEINEEAFLFIPHPTPPARGVILVSLILVPIFVPIFVDPHPCPCLPACGWILVPILVVPNLRLSLPASGGSIVDKDQDKGIPTTMNIDEDRDKDRDEDQSMRLSDPIISQEADEEIRLILPVCHDILRHGPRNAAQAEVEEPRAFTYHPGRFRL